MRWILGIVGLLVGNALAMAVLVISSSDGGAQVIPSYYERATHFDDRVAELRESRELGWRADATLVDGAVDIELRDRGGRAIEGAHVRASGYARAHAQRTFALDLVPVAPGHYRASGPIGRGWHDIEIVVEHAGQRFLQHAAIEAR